jgi:hypothetical protein
MTSPHRSKLRKFSVSAIATPGPPLPNAVYLISYRRAADYLNVNRVDVLSVQHEYGIFGGKAGSYVLTLLRELRMPIVTTLHTILEAPSDRQRPCRGTAGQTSGPIR